MKNYKTLSNATLSLNLNSKDFSKNFGIATKELRHRTTITETLKNGLSVLAVAVAINTDKHRCNPSKLTSVYKALKTANDRVSNDCKAFEKYITAVLPHMTLTDGIFNWKSRDADKMVLADGLELGTLKGYMSFEYPEKEKNNDRKAEMTDKKMVNFFKGLSAELAYFQEGIDADGPDVAEAAADYATMRRTFLESATNMFTPAEFAEMHAVSHDNRSVDLNQAESDAYAQELEQQHGEANTMAARFDLSRDELAAYAQEFELAHDNAIAQNAILNLAASAPAPKQKKSRAKQLKAV